ncbi:uncharacterized protein B4U80_04728 [Leptotrombidium deliense]|uniref:Uncharacterized protein n=1 Tax=Leptotrombidium deliense TaxID=299467 RepID=A0A443SDP5_9ACAR|nr:uncharacterized protein B4U80_04728 [Leptotrombidium deliense]
MSDRIINGEKLQENEERHKAWTKFEEGEKQNSDEFVLNAMNLSTIATLEPSQSFQVISHSSNDDNDRSRSCSPLRVSVLPPPPSVKRPTSATSVKQAASNSTVINVDNNEQSPNESPIHMAAVSNQMNNIPLNNLSNNVTVSSPKSFKNGDIIVSLLPQNTHCAWTTPAAFKPELVPEELMAQGLRLTVEDYVSAMQVLVNDYRFKLYIIFYKRILVVWIALGFVVLLTLLFHGVKGMALFGGGVLWLIINALGIFFSMWIKIKLYRMLERCVARANENLMKNNIIVAIDDRGKISCHKVHLIFIYFDIQYCIKYLNDMLENEQSSNAQPSLPPLSFSRHDIDASDIIITGSSPTRVSQKEKYGEKLLLRYSQRWAKDFVRSRIDLNVPLHGDASTEPTIPIPPRHCPKSRCPCQFVEEHLRFKPLTKCSIKELFC